MDYRNFHRLSFQMTVKGYLLVSHQVSYVDWKDAMEINMLGSFN